MDQTVDRMDSNEKIRSLELANMQDNLNVSIISNRPQEMYNKLLNYFQSCRGSLTQCQSLTTTTAKPSETLTAANLNESSAGADVSIIDKTTTSTTAASPAETLTPANLKEVAAEIGPSRTEGSEDRILEVIDGSDDKNSDLMSEKEKGQTDWYYMHVPWYCIVISFETGIIWFVGYFCLFSACVKKEE